MNVVYTKTSPWYRTEQNSWYLENLVYRPIPSYPDDPKYVIESRFKHRPDLLAYDLYQNPKLWWVFVHRNRQVLKDPIFDFLPGVTIFCPRKDALEDILTGA